MTASCCPPATVMGSAAIARPAMVGARRAVPRRDGLSRASGVSGCLRRILRTGNILRADGNLRSSDEAGWRVPFHGADRRNVPDRGSGRGLRERRSGGLRLRGQRSSRPPVVARPIVALASCPTPAGSCAGAEQTKRPRKRAVTGRCRRRGDRRDRRVRPVAGGCLRGRRCLRGRWRESRRRASLLSQCRSHDCRRRGRCRACALGSVLPAGCIRRSLRYSGRLRQTLWHPCRGLPGNRARHTRLHLFRSQHRRVALRSEDCEHRSGGLVAIAVIRAFVGPRCSLRGSTHGWPEGVDSGGCLARRRCLRRRAAQVGGTAVRQRSTRRRRAPFPARLLRSAPAAPRRRPRLCLRPPHHAPGRARSWSLKLRVWRARSRR